MKCWSRFPQLVTNVKVREDAVRATRRHPQARRQAEAEVKPAGGACCCVTPARGRKPACSSKARSKPCWRKWSKDICESIKRQVRSLSSENCTRRKALKPRALRVLFRPLLRGRVLAARELLPLLRPAFRTLAIGLWTLDSLYYEAWAGPICLECTRCGYRATVAGGAAQGPHLAVQTIHCLDCRELHDAVTELKVPPPPALRAGNSNPRRSTPA